MDGTVLHDLADMAGRILSWISAGGAFESYPVYGSVSRHIPAIWSGEGPETGSPCLCRAYTRVGKSLLVFSFLFKTLSHLIGMIIVTVNC